MSFYLAGTVYLVTIHHVVCLHRNLSLSVLCDQHQVPSQHFCNLFTQKVVSRKLCPYTGILGLLKLFTGHSVPQRTLGGSSATDGVVPSLNFSYILRLLDRGQNDIVSNYPPRSLASDFDRRHFLLVCVWVRNQAFLVNDFIAHHLVEGVSHFVFNNDESSDNIKLLLEPWQEVGVVNVIQTKHRLSQSEFYDKCYKDYSGKYSWITFLDVDERFVSYSESSLMNVLQRYERNGGVSFNWRLYEEPYTVVHNSDKHYIPLEAVSYKLGKYHPIVKTFAVVSKISGCAHNMPHCASFHAGFFATDDKHNKMERPCWLRRSHSFSTVGEILHFRAPTLFDGLAKGCRDFNRADLEEHRNETWLLGWCHDKVQAFCSSKPSSQLLPNNKKLRIVVDEIKKILYHSQT
uniref:Glycosyltransferase family 92 protein n=1 Tax=Tetraselmis sp. GSL018 TaxID=582737 RepID=A0A061RE59_9CHLO|mmetsp:Transcript_35464/g.84042  ORF Transcript_35464/g.84042 Transcript_35464/m.84042 type:complete len:404 (+) Transcript_35464:121-1332(+)